MRDNLTGEETDLPEESETTETREVVGESRVVEGIVCPDCGSDLVSNLYYIGGRGYCLLWECKNSLGELATCTYRRVI